MAAGKTAGALPFFNCGAPRLRRRHRLGPEAAFVMLHVREVESAIPLSPLAAGLGFVQGFRPASVKHNDPLGGGGGGFVNRVWGIRRDDATPDVREHHAAADLARGVGAGHAERKHGRRSFWERFRRDGGGQIVYATLSWFTARSLRVLFMQRH